MQRDRISALQVPPSPMQPLRRARATLCAVQAAAALRCTSVLVSMQGSYQLRYGVLDLRRSGGFPGRRPGPHNDPPRISAGTAPGQRLANPELMLTTPSARADTQLPERVV